MDRRRFLQMTGGLGLARTLPIGLPLGLLAGRTFAFSPDYTSVGFTPPAVLPQVINIFLYGGPSELAGNLTNIDEINASSENPYTEAFGDGILDFTGDGGQVTRHGFWQDAGGAHMEDMLAAGDLSVYRTLVKRKNDTRSHRESIFIGNKGSLAVENAPGVGTRLASLLYTNRNAVASQSALADGRAVSSFADGLVGMPLPFVSFEGESTAYALDPALTLPLALRPITLNRDFDNPYSRNGTNDTNEAVFQTLLNTALTDPGYRDRFKSAVEGFEQRQEMENLIGRLEAARDAALPSVGVGDPDANEDGNLEYPNNGFARNIQAAVTLAIANPSTLYITAGSDGLGGWDDHNNGVDKFPERMNDVMETLRIAMRHIRLSGTPGRPTDNIVINVFGDFGRLVNLNNSQGWDHANNQNLYTLGGAGVRPGGAAALGKVVGATRRVGEPGQNNQYTMPTSSSYEAEPLAVAASVYAYFGAQNPEVITADPVENPAGDGPIDESVAGEPTLF